MSVRGALAAAIRRRAAVTTAHVPPLAIPASQKHARFFYIRSVHGNVARTGRTHS